MSTPGPGEGATAWLPPQPAGEEQDLEPWQPRSVTDAHGPGVDWDSLGYIAVDQLEDGIVGLVISRWFGIDELGRLHFGEESDSSRIATLATALHRLTRRT